MKGIMDTVNGTSKPLQELQAMNNKHLFIYHRFSMKERSKVQTLTRLEFLTLWTLKTSDKS